MVPDRDGFVSWCHTVQSGLNAPALTQRQHHFVPRTWPFSINLCAAAAFANEKVLPIFTRTFFSATSRAISASWSRFTFTTMRVPDARCRLASTGLGGMSVETMRPPRSFSTCQGERSWISPAIKSSDQVDVADFVFKFLVAVVDHTVSAEAFDPRQILWARGGDHGRAVHLRELDGKVPHSTSRRRE